MQEVLRVKLDFSQAQGISSYGWHAVGFALLGMVLYIAALMCSHISAFHVQASMRTIMMKHIMTLPLGYIETEGSGKSARSSLIPVPPQKPTWPTTFRTKPSPQ